MLRHWRVKGIVQKALSVAPGGMWLNDQLQRRMGDLRDFDQNIHDKFSDWLCMINYLAEAGASLEGQELMEIGTGWYPTLPLLCSLAGAKSIDTFDLHRHLNEAWTREALQSLARFLDLIAEKSAVPRHVIDERYQALTSASSLDQLLERARIRYQAPADATSTGMPSDSFDLVFSNSVFEHVPAPVIAAMMHEARRVLRPGGLMLHQVGINDHYAFFDKSISFVNFLQFTENEWKLWNNSLLYQNRLRAPQLIAMAQAADFDILVDRRAVREGVYEALAHLPIAPEFAHFSKDELAATSCDFVARVRK